MQPLVYYHHQQRVHHRYTNTIRQWAVLIDTGASWSECVNCTTDLGNTTCGYNQQQPSDTNYFHHCRCAHSHHGIGYNSIEAGNTAYTICTVEDNEVSVLQRIQHQQYQHQFRQLTTQP
eukprot:3458089-Amphidinium_carterae.1